MPDPSRLTASEAARRIASGRLQPQTLMDACLDRIAAREDVVRAFAWLDPDQARRGAAAARPGPLHGLPVGVKDVIDTADMPSQYNSPIWRDHRPRADAAAVAWGRDVGAVIIGKTATTEFATRHPGPTTNPRDPRRTPGGSSSGSAAAVADYFLPLAFGTQTAGSIIRPAAYCGVVGYKPSFGLINRHGMKLMSESLDTVGALARSVADCALFVGAVAGVDLGSPDIRLERAPRIGLCRSPLWDQASPETQMLLFDAGERLARAGATIKECELPPLFSALVTAHPLVMNAESARALGWEMTTAREAISAELRERLEWGLAQPQAMLQEARNVFERTQRAFPAAIEGFDILLTPAAPGEAPEGIGWTGDPAFNFIWTSLHVPCVTVPAGQGPAGLPLGLQIVGRRGEDRQTLAWAQWTSAALG